MSELYAARNDNARVLDIIIMVPASAFSSTRCTNAAAAAYRDLPAIEYEWMSQHDVAVGLAAACA